MKVKIEGAILPYNLHDCVMVEIFDDHDLVVDFMQWRKDMCMPDFTIEVGNGNLIQVYPASDREDIEEFFEDRCGDRFSGR